MRTKIIVTLGPATRTENDLRAIKVRGVDFVRVNMSHSTLSDQEYFMDLARKVDIPFILDTEGSQVRNGKMKDAPVYVVEGNEVKIYKDNIIGDATCLSLHPAEIFSQLEEGDLIYIDFDAAILRIYDTSSRASGYIVAQVISAGDIGSNKGVVIDPLRKKKFYLPPLSEKDLTAIDMALGKGIEYIAASFMRNGDFVDKVRKATEGKMKIISKIECMEALQDLDSIIEKSDFLLIDRGDLSREVPLERIPFVQKIIIERARALRKGTFVATNFLESMVEKRRPTRAEVHDVEATILDGAEGLALAAETAIGRYPLEAINMLNKCIDCAEEMACDTERFPTSHVSLLDTVRHLRRADQITLVGKPHGGILIDREEEAHFSENTFAHLSCITLTPEQYMDAEQIATGAFSPLEGFLAKKDVEAVLKDMRLSSGIAWPIPIVLDVSEEDAGKLEVGKDVLFTNSEGEAVGLLHLEEKYSIDKQLYAESLYGTMDRTHPGVAMVFQMKPVLLGGKITLFKKITRPFKHYELTPRQMRKMFAERGWSRVVGFHTRNAIHRSHEYIQLEGMRRANADGLLVHPIVGKKKSGDFHALPIVKSYERMMKDFYPKNKVFMGTFATFSRYAGPREALFTALCRKNFGCSHFIVGRDHTGVGSFYAPKASHEIFLKFGKEELGITPIFFDDIVYVPRRESHVPVSRLEDNEEWFSLSGTEVRKMLERGEMPPEWFMRPEIANMILKMIKNGEEVFVE